MLTDKQIEEMSREMYQAGSPDWKVDQFIREARREQKISDSALASVKTASPESTTQQALSIAKDVGSRAVGMAVDSSLEAIGSSIGQTIGMASGRAAPIMTPVLGGLGGGIGNVVAQMRRDAPFDLGEAAGAAVAGAIPAGNTVKAGLAGTRSVANEALRAGAGNYAATLAQTAINEGRPPTLLEAGISSFAGMAGAKMQHQAGKGAKAAAEAAQKVDLAVTKQNIKDMVEAGYIVDPASSNPSAINKLADRIAGGSQVQRAAVKANQPVTNRLARESISYPQDWPLDSLHLTQHIKNLSEPYQEIRSISPLAEKIMEKLEDARGDQLAAWRKYNAFDRPPETAQLKKAARALDDKVEQLENALERVIVRSGKTALYEEYQKSRRLIGMANVVKAALGADGNVSAPMIGSMWDKEKRNLTGNLELIARADGTMPQVMRESAVTQSPGPTSFRPFLAAAAGGAGYKYFGVPGAIAGAGAVAYGDAPIRSAILSQFYQKHLAVPPALDRAGPDFGSTLLRFAGSSLGRPKQQAQPKKFEPKEEEAPAVPSGKEEKVSKEEETTKRLSFKIGKRYKDPDTGEVRVFLGDGQFALV